MLKTRLYLGIKISHCEGGPAAHKTLGKERASEKEISKKLQYMKSTSKGELGEAEREFWLKTWMAGANSVPVRCDEEGIHDKC